MSSRLRSLLLACGLGLLPLVLLGALTRTAGAAGPWYVAPGGSDAANCLSPATACASINAAIGKASAGDTVYVASGTYTASVGDEVVYIGKLITLSGGWGSGFAAQTGLSTVDGGGARLSMRIEGLGQATIDRFVIQNGTYGVSAHGNLTLTRSAVRNNLDGGLGVAAAQVIVTDSAITGNGGYGIYADSGDLSLNNTTVSGNSMLGAGIGANASITLNNTTVTNNAGGGLVILNSQAVLRNSIIAGNTGREGLSDCEGYGTITSLGYNLIGLGGCGLPGPGDLTGTAPHLAPLLGLPGYHPLVSTSPAVDAGDPGGCLGSAGLLNADQRGVARVGRCDIGAYEYTLPGPAVTMELVAGTPQVTPPSDTFPIPLQVRLLDSIGSPVNGALVTFTAPAAGASLVFENSGTSMTAVTSDGTGLASSGNLSANSVPGSYAVMATTQGLTTQVPFTMANLVWYVSPTGSDAADCLSPASACRSLDAPLNKPSFRPGGTIRAATGTYTRATGSEVLPLAVDSRFAGGWDSAFTSQSGMSTIDGAHAMHGAVVQPGVSASFERFIVRRGIVGIMVHHQLELVNSSVSHSLTSGIYLEAAGSLTMTNSTAGSNNGYGLFSAGGTVVLHSSTLGVNNDASVHNGPGGSLTMRNSLINTCYGPITQLTSLGHNVLGQGTCAFQTNLNDLVNVDPLLWPAVIGPNGTQPLLAGSPAIDAGDPLGCVDHRGQPLLVDQRGVARVGQCDIGAHEYVQGNNAVYLVYLPLLMDTCGQAICGHVRLNGTPAANVALDLRFYDGAAWSTAASTTTGSQGEYSFAGAPSLQPGQRYYVRYLNQADTPGRLGLWQTRPLTDYAAGTRLVLGSFDIADVVLTAPPPDALVALPYTFTWVRRPATPTDSYEFNVYDPVDGDPYGYTSLLGYVNGVTITGLPGDFELGATYVWEIWIYSPDGGVGISRETRPVRFANHGAAVSAAALDAGLTVSDRPPRPEDPAVSP